MSKNYHRHPTIGQVMMRMKLLDEMSKMDQEPGDDFDDLDEDENDGFSWDTDIDDEDEFDETDRAIARAEQFLMIDDAGLDYGELEFMDEFERDAILEAAGFDPEEFDWDF